MMTAEGVLTAARVASGDWPTHEERLLLKAPLASYDPSEFLDDGLEEFQIGTTRISDLGSDLRGNEPDKEALRAYLHNLKRSFIRVSWVAGVSFVLCLVSFFDLSLFFHGGNSLLHPWNSFFLGLAALCMLVVSIFAIFTAMQYLKSVVQEICKE